jgi:hypothetical protein
MVSIRSNRDWSKEEAQARSKGIDVNRLGGQGGVGPSACQAAADSEHLPVPSCNQASRT